MLLHGREGSSIGFRRFGAILLAIGDLQLNAILISMVLRGQLNLVQGGAAPSGNLSY